ncbi:MAG: hypothetical protein II829_05015 [Bacteroidales bacterium]|nr:hypothetical protein [Bacteroidales bacterium]
MKVKLYIENDLNRYDECCVEAEFFSAPHAGDYVVADWYSIIDAILKADKTEYYTYYLIGETYEWYKDPEAQKTKKKPTDEQIRKDFLFDGIGLVKSVTWIVDDGIAYCRAWVGQI